MPAERRDAPVPAALPSQHSVARVLLWKIKVSISARRCARQTEGDVDEQGSQDFHRGVRHRRCQRDQRFCGSGDVRHQLARPGRAWRLLPGCRRRHLRRLRPRGHDPAGRPAGRRPAAAACRQDRLLHGRQPAAGLRRGGAGHPVARRRRHLPEGAAGADDPSRPGSRQVGRFEERRSVHSQRRGCAELPSVDGDRVRLRSRQARALHLQPGAVPRQQEVGRSRAT